MSQEPTATGSTALTATARQPATRRRGFVERLTSLPTPVKVVLWLALVLLLYLLPIIEPPLLSTPDTDFGGVLFTVSVYVLIALGLWILSGAGVLIQSTWF